MLENTLNIKKLEVLALHMRPLVQLYNTLKNNIKATQYVHSAVFSLECYISNRQLKSVCYHCHNVLFLARSSSYLQSSFLCLTTQHVTTQFMGFVGSYCMQQEQHRLW